MKKRRAYKNSEIDDALYKKFVIKRSKNVPINGPILTLTSFCKTNDLKDLQHKYKQPSILD